MRSASPPISLTRKPALGSLTAEPQRVLVVANALSISRGVAALAVFILSLAGASWDLVIAIAVGMWATDTLDGMVARVGHKLGAARRTDGAALDPLMDDVAFICGFLILLSVGGVDLWFVGGLLVFRVLFSLIRMTGLAHNQQFARSTPLSKLSGATLAVGQILLFAHVAYPGGVVGSASAAAFVETAMVAVTLYSVYDFAVRRHWRTLAKLLSP